MRKVIVIIVSLLMVLGVNGQDYEVKRFALRSADLSARTKPMLDNNGVEGALVKVFLAVPDVTFEGNVIGSPLFKTNHYWVYLVEGSKFLTVNIPNASPVTVTFADYQVPRLQAKTTYELTFQTPQGKAAQQQFTIKFSPQRATVLVDNNLIEPSAGGMATGSLSLGRHEFVVTAPGYEPLQGVFTLKESAPYSVEVHLTKSAANAVQTVVATSTPNPTEQSSEATHSANSQYILDQVAEGKRLYDAESYSEAVKCFRVAAEAGNAEGQLQFAKCYAQGNGVAKDYTEAAKWVRKAVEQGYAEAQYNLAICYYNGQGVEQSYSEAVKWYRKAAEQGYAAAQYNLGVCYDTGQGVEQSYTESVKWYRKAADQGHAQAQYNLAICYVNGQGVEQSYSEAVKWYRKAADQGHAGAQWNLGVCYVTGHGVEQSYTESVKWWRKAADQGNAKAQYNLGVCYDKGQGVEQSYSEAVKWWRKAAEQGEADAQVNLGYCYEKGHGVEQNYAEAVKWTRKAAEQGEVIAQSNLGEYYETGKGVPLDKAEALKWYRRAAEQGKASAQKKVDTYPNW